MELRINFKQNILYYSFIISIFLHIIFFTLGSILINSKKEDKFQKLTMISILQNLEHKDIPIKKDLEESEIVKKGTQQHKIEENTIKEKRERIKKSFLTYKNKNSQSQLASGSTEIINSILEDSSDDFIVQNIPKDKGKGIGSGENGSGIEVAENEDSSGMLDTAEVSQKPEPEQKIDKDKILREYQVLIVKIIQENKIYPEEAREQGIEGRAKVKFAILSTGNTENVRLTSSSGFEMLDEGAISTIRKCNPFPKIPEELELPKLSFELSIVFELK